MGDESMGCESNSRAVGSVSTTTGTRLDDEAMQSAKPSTHGC